MAKKAVKSSPKPKKQCKRKSVAWKTETALYLMGSGTAENAANALCTKKEAV